MPFNRQTLGIVFQSCNGHCYYCGDPLQPFGDWEVDHMRPRQQGGTDALYNLVAACRRCNRSKGNASVDEFRAAILRRVLNHITAAREIVDIYRHYPADHLNESAQLGEQLEAAEDLGVNWLILFYGETTSLPRDDDPAFDDPNDPALPFSSDGTPEASM